MEEKFESESHHAKAKLPLFRKLRKYYNWYTPPFFVFVLIVFAFTLVLYGIFRFATLKYNRPNLEIFGAQSNTLLRTFWIGLGYDTFVVCVSLIPPFLMLAWSFFISHREKLAQRIVRIYLSVTTLIAFIICAADLPYFHFFNSRLNRTATNFQNLGHSFGYIFKEPAYYPVIIASGFAVWGVNRLILYIWKRTHKIRRSHRQEKAITSAILFSLLLWGAIGVRGPRKPEAARTLFSEDGFFNQLALNPVHTWFDSFFRWDLPHVPLPNAIKKVQNELNIDSEANPFESPIARKHTKLGHAQKRNVVLILMESMSAGYMGVYGKQEGSTPGLDSLARESVFFENCFSNGIHTNAGLYSSLYGMPIFMLDHPMLNTKAEAANFTGLPVTLRDLGYRTSFFCTHGKAFDNVGNFLSKNGFDAMYDVDSYDQKKVVNTWGVPDETLFEYGFAVLDSMAHDTTRKPFFATLLTITSHPPYDLPPFTQFVPKSEIPRDQAYEYADWAITSFMRRCAKADWYKNTIFVLVGDHGLKLNDSDEVPLSYNHVPLIIQAPGVLKMPQVQHGIANQSDIYPTVMGILGLPYVQNTLGYDLMREERPYAFFSQDEKLGVINHKFLYVARKTGEESISLYNENQGRDLSHQYSITKGEMGLYAAQMLQVSQWLIEKNLTKKPELKE